MSRHDTPLTPDEKHKVGRLAMRQEGNWWVGYFAMVDTMDGALELGRIRLNGAKVPAIKQAFLTVMQSMVNEAILVSLSVEVARWDKPVAAPEHERGGNA